MSRNRIARARRKQALWRQQQGRCYWCACVMLHWNDLKSDPIKRDKYGVKLSGHGVVPTKVKTQPRNLATIEHLRDRFDPTRQQRPRNQEQRWALACLECNSERGRERQAAQPIENLRERARHEGAMRVGAETLDGIQAR